MTNCFMPLILQRQDSGEFTKRTWRYVDGGGILAICPSCGAGYELPREPAGLLDCQKPKGCGFSEVVAFADYDAS